MKVLVIHYKIGPQKFSLGLGLVSFGSGDETSLGQHSMYLPSFYLTSPHLKILPCRSVFAIKYAIKYRRQLKNEDTLRGIMGQYVSLVHSNY